MQNYIDEEVLISLVEKEECLYNKFSAGFKSTLAKDAKWTKIAEELGVPEDQCRRRWTSLRDRFSRECRRLDMASDSGAAAVDPWPFFESMSFLRTHVKSRADRCSSNIRKERSRSPSPVKSTLSATLEENPISETIYLFDEGLPLSGTSSPIAPNIGKPNKKKRKAGASNIDDSFEDAVDAFKKLCKAREVRKDNEVVQGFGKMICGLISDMSAQKQIRTMQRVMEIVTEIRLDELHR